MSFFWHCRLVLVVCLMYFNVLPFCCFYDLLLLMKEKNLLNILFDNFSYYIFKLLKLLINYWNIYL